MKTFRLKERKSELKWELKMMEEVDEELVEYVKFEQENNRKLQKTLLKL